MLLGGGRVNECSFYREHPVGVYLDDWVPLKLTPPSAAMLAASGREAV